jgi:hypothetical protein
LDPARGGLLLRWSSASAWRTGWGSHRRWASTLGIGAAWSWTLLWSLLVFNLGIEVVQLAIVAVAAQGPL